MIDSSAICQFYEAAVTDKFS